MTWAALFEQAAEYEIEEDTVLQALEAHRAQAGEAPEDEP